jgi:hypothetical protein
MGLACPYAEEEA